MTEEDKENNTKGESEPEEQKKEERPELLKDPISIKDYIYFAILSLEGKAWAFMDFVVHPETQKHTKDLNQARLAIDAMDALLKIADNEFTPEQKKDIQNRLTNLRLNFAKT